MNLRVTWTLPAPTTKQRPVAHVEISTRVDASLPWTQVDLVDPTGAQELLITDIDPGTWFVQAVVVDVAGDMSVPVESSVDIPFDTPSPVENLVLTVE